MNGGRGPGLVGSLVVILSVLHPAPASAGAVTLERFRQLVSEAPENPAAMAELRLVDVVDGRSVDMAAAFQGADTQELAARLVAIERGLEPAPVDAAVARAAAGAILAEERFQPSTLPRPFHALFESLADKLRPVFEPIAEAIGRIIDRLAGAIPGPRWFGWVALSIVVLAVAAVAAFPLARRRARAIEQLRAGDRARKLDPAMLERAADEAERKGDLATALRLRFRAGLVRLDRAHAIELRESLTTRQVARSLRSETYESLAGTFEDVAYGGRPATRTDVDESRAGWRTLLDEVGA